MGEWVKETLSRLKGVGASAAGVSAKVSKVKDVEGSASVVASRGAVRHLMDYSFGLEFKVVSGGGEGGGGEDGGEEGDGEAPAATKPLTVCKGTLSYSEVTCAKAGSIAIGDVAHSFKSAPAADAKVSALAAVDALKESVHAVLVAFDDEYRTAKRL